MPFLGFFRLKFDETIVIPEISTLELVKMHEFVQNKKKKMKFGTKNVFFGYFSAAIFKNYCHI